MSVYGISRDSPWSHVAWKQVLEVEIDLLSDWNGEAVRAFGVATEFRGMRDVPVRSAFLVDREGIIRGAWQYAPQRCPTSTLLSAARSLPS